MLWYNVANWRGCVRIVGGVVMNRQKYYNELKQLQEETEHADTNTMDAKEFEAWADKKRRIYELTAILYN